MTATLDELLGGRLRLAEALRAAEEQAADATRAAFLHAVLQDALRVVAAVAADDALWRRLRDAAGELRPGDVAPLAALVDHRLAPLLTAFGYEEPPPPPVHELVDTTAELLGYAVAAVGDPVRAQYAVDIARSAVQRFVDRARVQIDAPVMPDRRALRSWGRRVQRMLERLVPPVAGAGAAALVVGVLGGAEGGVLAGAAYKSVEELVKQLVELSAAYVVGWGEEVRAATPVPSLPPGGLRLAELELLTEAFGAGIARWSAERGARAAERLGKRSFGDALPAGLRGELDEIAAALDAFAAAVPGGRGRGGRGGGPGRKPAPGGPAGSAGAGELAEAIAEVGAALDALRRMVPPAAPSAPSGLPVPAMRPVPSVPVLSVAPASPEDVDRAAARLVRAVRGLRGHLDSAIG